MNLVTSSGYNRLIEDLNRLSTTERMSVAKEIEVARGFGDLSENAEYTYAKEKQAHLEKKIFNLNQFLENCRVVSLRDLKQDGSVLFGSTVTIKNLDDDRVKKFKIVGVPETNVEEGRISYKAPIAACLIGKKAGDDVDVETPNSYQNWEIISVEYI